MGVLAQSLAILGMLTSRKSLENHETDQERCILSRKVYLKAIGQGFHTKPSPTLGSLPAGLKFFAVGFNWDKSRIKSLGF